MAFVTTSGTATAGAIAIGTGPTFGGWVDDTPTNAVFPTAQLNGFVNDNQQQIKSMKIGRETKRIRIIDHNPNINDNDALIFDSGEILTNKSTEAIRFDMTEQIKAKLMAHNSIRVKTVNKEQSAESGKEVLLEPLGYDDLTFKYNNS